MRRVHGWDRKASQEAPGNLGRMLLLCTEFHVVYPSLHSSKSSYWFKLLMLHIQQTSRLLWSVPPTLLPCFKIQCLLVGCALSNIHLLLLLRDSYSSDCSSGDTDRNVILSGEYLASLLSYGNVYCKIPFSSLLHRNEVKSQGKNLTWEVRALHFFLGLIQIVAANTWA